MKILLTAFEAFNNDSINPSEEILKEIIDDNIIKKLLPVSYKRSKQELIDTIKKEKIDFILSLGYAASRKEISIEAKAQNEMQAIICDNDGIKKEGDKIKEAGPDYLYTNVNIKELLNYMPKQQAYESNDAGKFICNLVYYLSLDEMDGNALFVHIPPLDIMCKDGKDLNFLVNAIKDIINYLRGDK